MTEIHDPKCKGTPHYYDGALGYEALRCDVCGYELDLNAEANDRATAEREAAQFIRDAAAFLRFGFANNLDEREMLATLVHDIGGLARRDRCFLPRVDGYARDEAEHKNDD